ncbi:MAG: DUF5706 domain-containing protein [Chloroflexota bacterium]|nr:DUF5706 domain-containing protein [Chloroflexota bacterium]
MIQFLDTKAAGIVAFNGILLSLVVNNLFETFKLILSMKEALHKRIILTIVGIITLAFLFHLTFVLYAAFMVLLPRRGKGHYKTKGLFWALDVFKYLEEKGVDAYRNDIKTMKVADVLDEMSSEVIKLARIMRLKFTYSEIAVRRTIVTTLLWIILIVIPFIVRLVIRLI